MLALGRDSRRPKGRSRMLSADPARVGTLAEQDRAVLTQLGNPGPITKLARQGLAPFVG